ERLDRRSPQGRAEQLAAAVDSPKPERLRPETATPGSPDELREVARVRGQQRRRLAASGRKAIEALLRRHDAEDEAARPDETADRDVLLDGGRRPRADVDLHAVLRADLTAEQAAERGHRGPQLDLVP